ncbi:UPF0758 domain-containing protein [Pedobacter namyangjuensis]|uniref:UPF0758 domain-containing protein n=1 Tax=Pedobacter namyangjuensis TaxID=600626 RepID=UPI000DE23C54|nr:UPF0758 domain-containing protein [Pedobacter namyangjuensis]
METTMMYSEAFPSNPMRHYFFDLKQGMKGHNFLQISCSERQRDGSFLRNRIIIFLRDLPMAIEALTSVCHHAAYLKLDQPEQTAVQAQESQQRRLSAALASDASMAAIDRLKKNGASSLADEELVSLLFSAGLSSGQSVELAKKLLKECGGVIGLSKAPATQLKSLPDIGDVRSSAILAVAEIARRINAC